METILKVLEHDHDKVKQILSKMEETTSRAVKTRDKLIGQLKQELLPHMYAEEEYLYQLLLDESDGKEHLWEGIEEHRAARFVLSDLEATPLDDPKWSSRLSVLKELVEHHIEEEQDEVFPLAQNAFDPERSQSVAREFQKVKKRQDTQVHIASY